MSRISDEMRRDARKSPQELEHEIDATRADLEQTLEALERRLSPEGLFNEALGRARRYGGDFAQNLGDDIREHPVPTLLASVGIAWLVAAQNRRRDGDGALRREGELRREMHNVASTMKRRGRAAAGAVHHGHEAARERIQRGEDAAREGIASSRAAISRSVAGVRSGAQSASSAIAQAEDRSREAARSARRRVRGARQDAQQLLADQPLLLGVLGIAAGAIAGAALPASRQEDETLGPMRDRALDRAEGTGKEALEAARTRARNALEAGRRAAEAEDGSSHPSRADGPSRATTGSSAGPNRSPDSRGL